MARRPVVLPIKTEAKAGKCDPHESFSHDAFGLITMTNPSGGDDTLFGSDVKHNHRVCIKIQRATLDRSLSNDWIFGRGHLVEFEMSHAQFAQFITSSGNGSGTPVTLRYAPPPESRIAEMPGIGELESKADIFRREIKDSAKRQLEDLTSEIKRLGDLIETGKIGIKDAREVHRNLTIRSANIPSNMQFVVGQAEEALEKAQTAAKIQIEAFVENTIRRAGLNSFSQLVEIENKLTENKSLPDESSHN